MVEQPVHERDLPVYKLTLGKVVASLRKEAGISQEDFAEAVGISQPTLSRIERGEAIPDAQVFNEMAVQLEMRPGDLYNLVQDAMDRAGRAAAGASNEAAGSESIWSTVLRIAGVVGIAGLVAFAVAAVLNERGGREEDEDERPRSRGRRRA